MFRALKWSSLHVVVDFEVGYADVVLAAFLVNGGSVGNGSQVLTGVDHLKRAVSLIHNILN